MLLVTECNRPIRKSHIDWVRLVACFLLSSLILGNWYFVLSWLRIRKLDNMVCADFRILCVKCNVIQPIGSYRCTTNLSPLICCANLMSSKVPIVNDIDVCLCVALIWWQWLRKVNHLPSFKTYTSINLSTNKYIYTWT